MLTVPTRRNAKNNKVANRKSHNNRSKSPGVESKLNDALVNIPRSTILPSSITDLEIGGITTSKPTTRIDTASSSSACVEPSNHKAAESECPKPSTNAEHLSVLQPTGQVSIRASHYKVPLGVVTDTKIVSKTSNIPPLMRPSYRVPCSATMPVRSGRRHPMADRSCWWPGFEYLHRQRTTKSTSSDPVSNIRYRPQAVPKPPITSSGSDLQPRAANRYHVLSYGQVKRLHDVMVTRIAVSPKPASLRSASGFSPFPYIPVDSYPSAQSSPQSGYCYCGEPSSRGYPGVYGQSYPTVYIRLKELVSSVRNRLLEEKINVREVRLNGGAASCILEMDAVGSYSDIDLIFSVDLSDAATCTKIKSVVLSSIAALLSTTAAAGMATYQEGARAPVSCPMSHRAFSSPMVANKANDCTNESTDCYQIVEAATDTTAIDETGAAAASATSSTSSVSTLKATDSAGPADTMDSVQSGFQANQESLTNDHAPEDSHGPCNCAPLFLPTNEFVLKQYIQKMVRINNSTCSTADSWSLISLGYQTPGGAKTIELKFVDRMRRQFEFTVDSFQISLDSLLTFYEGSEESVMTQHFYPTVIADSVSGNFFEALTHLQGRIIATRNPEEIRGGGLLKYCKLLVEGYRPSEDIEILSMERYMCSRFFIDFPDVVGQHTKLTAYLANHFGHDDNVKVKYLQILRNVVSHSTVCLMSHERQQTLHLISSLLLEVTSRVASQKCVLHLEEFSRGNWALDQVFYGTDCFPTAVFIPAKSISTQDAATEVAAPLSNDLHSLPETAVLQVKENADGKLPSCPEVQTEPNAGEVAEVQAPPPDAIERESASTFHDYQFEGGSLPLPQEVLSIEHPIISEHIPTLPTDSCPSQITVDVNSDVSECRTEPGLGTPGLEDVPPASLGVPYSAYPRHASFSRQLQSPTGEYIDGLFQRGAVTPGHMKVTYYSCLSYPYGAPSPYLLPAYAYPNGFDWYPPHRPFYGSLYQNA